MELINGGRYYFNGNFYTQEELISGGVDAYLLQNAYKGTIAYSIISSHDKNKTEKGKQVNISFDALASHDITYVGIIQTAKASGLKDFPVPYVLTNCHNSLCAVGGTINEDDHVFGLSAAKKYGGIFVPPHQAVIHTFMREQLSACGKMILGSDSHTRYGALGTMAMGEGGPELVKQLLKRTYDIKYPDVVAVNLTGKVKHGVGPHDVAIALVGAVFNNAFVKNSVMEFIGDGIKDLPIEFRNGIDVMTTETACLTSIWQTDEAVEKYYAVHGRKQDYKQLSPKTLSYYDRVINLDLSEIEPMIALPFHPSNAYKLKDVIQNPYDVFNEVEKKANALIGNRGSFCLTDKIKDGKIYVEQGVIAGCAGGTYDNVYTAASILKNNSIGNGKYTLSVYPSSTPIMNALVKNGAVSSVLDSGAIVKTCFCGPCFGAGDTPANGALSIRHTTRNFESREGSKPSDGQLSCVALMDARSIAATSINGGVLTSATDVDYDENVPEFVFDQSIYAKRVYDGYGKPDKNAFLVYGPNIADWPEQRPLKDVMLIDVAASISDPVTTTDELIPSGETSSLRSNPIKLSEYALSRKRPGYVKIAKEIKGYSDAVKAGGKLPENYRKALEEANIKTDDVTVGSAVYAVKPGDGSAREQAASCQRVLGGVANVAKEYATKRYRSNLINWGMIPFLFDRTLEERDIIVVPDVKKKILNGDAEFNALLIRGSEKKDIVLTLAPLTEDERQIIIKGCLINFYKD